MIPSAKIAIRSTAPPVRQVEHAADAGIGLFEEQLSRVGVDAGYGNVGADASRPISRPMAKRDAISGGSLAFPKALQLRLETLPVPLRTPFKGPPKDKEAPPDPVTSGTSGATHAGFLT